jgi:hypothetical protein
VEEAKLGKATTRQKKTARRRLKSLLTTKKATSQVFGALLMVIVTLVAGLFFYNMISGSIGSMTKNINEEMETLFLKSVDINSTCITSFIGNSGMWTISIMNAYINDQIANLQQSVEIGKNSVEPVYILGTFSSGLTYVVKLVSNFGGPITFDVSFA